MEPIHNQSLVAVHYVGVTLMGVDKYEGQIGVGRYTAAFGMQIGGGPWIEVAVGYRAYRELQKLTEDDCDGLLFDLEVSGDRVSITKVEDAATSADVSS